MPLLKYVLVLLFLAGSLASAQEPPFIVNKLDLTPSFLSPFSFQNATVRVASNINIQRILPLAFLKKAIGYVAVTRLPARQGVHPAVAYLCELQLRYLKLQSSNMQVFFCTGNTLNFGEHNDISCDAGGGIRYALGPQLYIYFPATFTLYPGGLMTTAEPGIVWHGFSFSYRTTNVIYRAATLPATDACFAVGYRLSL